MCKSKVTKSIFGEKIDKSCPGYGFFAKLFVFLGVLSNREEGDRFAKVDEELDSRVFEDTSK
jgi:hypothetical protein